MRSDYPGCFCVGVGEGGVVGKCRRVFELTMPHAKKINFYKFSTKNIFCDIFHNNLDILANRCGLQTKRFLHFQK